MLTAPQSPVEGYVGGLAVVGITYSMPTILEKAFTRRSLLTNGNLDNFNLRQE